MNPRQLIRGWCVRGDKSVAKSAEIVQRTLARKPKDEIRRSHVTFKTRQL